jgi:lysyl-tRNA synthetase class 2
MSSSTRSPRAAPAALLSSVAVAVTGGAIAFALVSGDGGGPLLTEPGPPTDLPHVMAGAGAVMLGIVAHGLWRGSRRAAMLAGVALAALAVIATVHGKHVMTAGLATMGVMALTTARGSFRTGAAGIGTRLPAVVATGSVLGAWAIAVATVLSADRVRGLGAAIAAAAAWLWGGSWWLDSMAPSAVGLDALVVVALCSAAVFVGRLLRPAASAVGHDADEHRRAAAIVARYATDSLAPFALREDKSFHFACGGMLAYRTLRGTAVVSGDPIGPDGTAALILEDFERVAAARGWDVILTSASERHLAQYRALGYKTLCIGEEAVVDPSTFSLAGRSMKALRHAVTRQGRRGWTIETVPGSELTPVLTDELAHVETAWRADRPRLTGFSMTLGRLWGAEEDGDSLYVIGRDPDGAVRAFLRFARYRSGLSLDVMRRVGESPNGLNDALVVTAIEYARAHGMQAVSLNFAGFAHVMAPGRELPPSQRAMRWLLSRTRGHFQLERLVTFNKKFGPRWERRYLVHREPRRLPVVGLRVLQAEAYLRTPRTRPLTARWEPGALPVARARAPLHLS